MEISKQKRNIEIDLIKGLAIILMVVGHTSAQENFAFITEYWTWKGILINILKGCILPGNVQMDGALWFLATLLQVSVGYCVIDFFLKRFFGKKHILWAQLIVSIILLVIGYFFCIKNVYIFGIDSFFSCYCLFYLGIILHKYSDKLNVAKDRNAVIIMVSCFMILCYLNVTGSISLNVNKYNNPFFLLIASLSGWFMLYGAAMLMKKNAFVVELMSYVGRNTLPIVILHFLAFKLVSLVAVLVNGDELYYIAAFPALYTDMIWRMFYVLVGVAVPLGANELWQKMKKRVCYGKN